MTNKAIFFDRDGVLNKDFWYVYMPNRCHLENNILKSELKQLRTAWYLLIVITNQSWIGRWYYSEKDFHRFNSTLEGKLWIHFDRIYFCPHLPEYWCNCRKPSIGMILLAQRDYNIILSESYIIWDKESDILCWINAWTKTIYYWNKQIAKSDYCIENLKEITNIIL